MEKKSRTHRVGSVTTGISMVVFGSMFLLHIFFGLMSYERIFKLWPFIMIGLGIEILLSNIAERKFVYDKAAVFLLIILMLFAACMAWVDLMLTYFGTQGHVYF